MCSTLQCFRAMRTKAKFQESTHTYIYIYITAVKSSVNDTVHADKRRKQNKKTITATPQQQQQQEVRCTHKSPSRTGKRAERGKERRCNVGIDLTFLSIILAVVVNLQWHTDVHSYTSFFFLITEDNERRTRKKCKKMSRAQDGGLGLSTRRLHEGTENGIRGVGVPHQVQPHTLVVREADLHVRGNAAMSSHPLRRALVARHSDEDVLWGWRASQIAQCEQRSHGGFSRFRRERSSVGWCGVEWGAGGAGGRSIGDDRCLCHHRLAWR